MPFKNRGNFSSYLQVSALDATSSLDNKIQREQLFLKIVNLQDTVLSGKNLNNRLRELHVLVQNLAL